MALRTRKSLALLAGLGMSCALAVASVGATSSGQAGNTTSQVTPDEILQAVYFDAGPAADLLRDQGLADLGNDDAEESTEDLVTDVLTENPAFARELESSIESGDPFLIEDSLREGGELLTSTLGADPSLLSDGRNVGAITFIVAVNWIIDMVFVSPAPASVTTNHEVGVRMRDLTTPELEQAAAAVVGIVRDY